MTYTFTIPLAPEAAPKHCTRRFGAGGLQRYQNPKGAQWRLAVAACAADVLAGVQLDGPQRVDIVAVFARPQRLLKIHGRGPLKGAYVHGTGRLWHDKKPDRDNIDKGILDGLKNYWRDDCIVCCGEVLKFYCAVGELPHVEVYIRDAPPIDGPLLALRIAPHHLDGPPPLSPGMQAVVEEDRQWWAKHQEMSGTTEAMRGVKVEGVMSGREAGLKDIKGQMSLMGDCSSRPLQAHRPGCLPPPPQPKGETT